MVDLKVELLGQLPIDGFNNLADGIEGVAQGFRGLAGLVAAGQGQEREPIMVEQLESQFSTDVALIAKDGQVGMFGQEFGPDRQVSGVGWCQLEIQDQPSQTDQQVQLEAENGDFLADNLAKVGTMSGPIARRTRHQMKLDDWHGQRVNRTLPIRAQIQQPQHALSYDVKGIHQCSTPPIKATLRWNMRKQIPMLSPLTKHRRFHVPSPTFTHQRHRQQLTVAALSRWPRSFEQRVDLLPYGIDHYVHPQAKIVKVFYHHPVSLLVKGQFGDLTLPN